jgi:hypothetical protein
MNRNEIKLTPCIQLNNFQQGLFPCERTGTFLDYSGEEQTLVIQTANSKFTKEGLLEVKVKGEEGDRILIEVYHECYPARHIIKRTDLKYRDRDEIKYVN